MYNVAKGTWATAAMSVARTFFAATHVGNLAMFAGGATTTGSGLKPNLNLSTLNLKPSKIFLHINPQHKLQNHKPEPKPGFANTVDIFNVSSGLWTTAALSVARASLAATTVGNLAIFVGGDNGSALRVLDM